MRSNHSCQRLLSRSLAGFGALVLVFVIGCQGPSGKKADKEVDVDVTTPITDTVIEYQDFTGRLESSVTVDIRPRVSGYIEKAQFKEGERVEKGDLLFQIEPSLFKADYDEAEANLNLANAEKQLQETNAGRARLMLSSRAIGREEFDQITASKDKSKASVVALTAALKRATVRLGYTKVLSPIKGRVSRRAVDEGNLVKSDETLLTTVVDDDTMFAYFDVDERTYLDLIRAKFSSTSKKFALADLHLKVLMRLANKEEFEETGEVDFIDNRLNGNTGTIRMRGKFPNQDGHLKAGLFVRVRLPVSAPKPNTLLIPDEAIQSDQGDKFIYVVDPETKKVEYRKVEVGQALSSVRSKKLDDKSKEDKKSSGEGNQPTDPAAEPEIQTLRVIKTGSKSELKPGDLVIVNGIQRVRANQVVKFKKVPPPNLPNSPLRNLMAEAPNKIQPQVEATAKSRLEE